MLLYAAALLPLLPVFKCFPYDVPHASCAPCRDCERFCFRTIFGSIPVPVPILQEVLKFSAKPFHIQKYDKLYFFDPMNIKEPGEYTWVSTHGVLRVPWPVTFDRGHAFPVSGAQFVFIVEVASNEQPSEN